MKKRILLIVVVLGIPLATGVGIWMYHRHSVGWRLLARAQVAVDAGKFDEAARLAGEYIEQTPTSWRGYYWKAMAYARSGRYDQARSLLQKVLTEAQQGSMDAPPYDVPMLLANTYAQPAREVLGRRTADREERLAAVEQLVRANEVLATLKLQDAAKALDIREQRGRNLFQMGLANRALAETEPQRAAARAQLAKAADELLAVVKEDPTRSRAARELVELCQLLDDPQRTQAARQAILEAPDPPATAAADLILAGLEVPADGEQTPNRTQLDDAAARLDAIIQRHDAEVAPKLARARVALWRGQAKKAEVLCREALKTDPRHRLTRLVLAQALEMQGRTEEAERMLWTLKTDFPTWAAARYAYARSLLASGDEESARRELKSVIELRPDHGPALRARATLLAKAGVLADAVTVAQQYYRTHPDSIDALGLLVDLARRTRQVSLAEEALDTARQTFAERPRSLLTVAQGYGAIGNGQARREVLAEIAEVEPTNPAQVGAKARALLALGQPTKAERLLVERYGASRDPTLAYELGRLYLDTQRAYQAVEMFETALELAGGSDQMPWQLALARALFETGDIERCEDVLAQLPSEYPEAAYLRLRLGVARGQTTAGEMFLAQVGHERGAEAAALAYLATGEPGKCIELCRQELASGADSARLRWLLGQAHLRRREHQECVRAWTKALALEPTRFSVYRSLAEAMVASGQSVEEIRTALTAVEHARPDLVELACGWVLEQRGRSDDAIESYRGIASRAGVEPETRRRARLGLVGALARGGQTDAALAELEPLISDPVVSTGAAFLKARLLVAAGRRRQGLDLLDQIRHAATEKGAAEALSRAAWHYARMEELDRALDALERARQLRPEDPVVHIRLGAILHRLHRPAEATRAYETAIDLRPNDFHPYRALARMQSDQLDPSRALATLDRLAGLGQAGRSISQLQKARLLARWGLYGPAVACLEELAATSPVQSPQLRYELGAALAALGAQERAREVLKAIGAHTSEYRPAQQLLARLAKDTPEKLRILSALAEAHPDNPGVLLQRMEVLRAAEQAEEAVRLYRAFRQDRAAGRPLPGPVLVSTLRALLDAQDPAAAAALAAQRHAADGQDAWRTLTALFHLGANDPAAALQALPAPQDCRRQDAVLGLCAAGRAGQPVAPWVRRLDKLHQALAAQDPPGSLPLEYRVLAALVAGDAAAADRLVAEAQANDTEDGALLHAVAAAEVRPTATEAGSLLCVRAARELGFDQWASRRALDVLRARPTCQWAAVAALRGGGVAPGSVLEILRPADCLLARAVGAMAAAQEGAYEKAAVLFAQVCESGGDGPWFGMERARALEMAGQLDAALDAYRGLWGRWADPAAANNAAFILTRLHGDDAEKLKEAAELAAKAVEAAPGVAAFRDTLGWIALLRGEHERALGELRRAVRGLPNSIEVHAHLGRAEAAAGHRQWARWHSQAAVDAAERRRQDGPPCGQAEQEAVRIAQQTLKTLEPPAP